MTGFPGTALIRYFCQPPLETEIGDQGSRMVVEILTADLGSTMGIGIVAPRENSCTWDI